MAGDDIFADCVATMETARILRLIARRLQNGDVSVIPRAVEELDKTADQLEFMADALKARGLILRKVES
jgi:hypothetical protein